MGNSNGSSKIQSLNKNITNEENVIVDPKLVRKIMSSDIDKCVCK